MTSNPNPPDAIELLASTLSGPMFGLARCPDTASLLKRTANDPAGFVLRSPLLIGGHYDIQPAITLYSAQVGTLAFIEEISRQDPKADLLTSKAIERAAAVRQILIEQAERQSRSGPRTLALQVELVLLVSGAVAKDSPDPLRNVLTNIARQTGYLRLIGMSVLDLERQALDSSEPALRRAFAWLLTETNKWFRRKAFLAGGPVWRNGGKQMELRLRDYRTAGLRKFRCDGAAWLNLVHGHNGSGKSSLVEAFELLLTNRIQRLDEGGEKNYFLVVRHRPAGVSGDDLLALTPAEVALHLDTPEPKSLVRIGNGSAPIREGEAPAKNVQVNSFRIDQVFMDKLIRSQAAGRAALFLNAFSPTDVDLLPQLRQLRNEVRSGWLTLPEHLRKRAETHVSAPAQPQPVEGRRPITEEEMAEFIVREMGSLYVPAAGQDTALQVPRAALEALLPAEQSDMTRLAQIHPPLAESVKKLLDVRDRGGLAEAASQLQTNLASLYASLPRHLSDLRTALRVFSEFRSWKAAERGARGESFDSDLNRWLDLQALADLTAKYAEIVSTIEAALAKGWKPDTRDIDLLRLEQLPAGLGALLTARKTELGAELNTARERVESWKESDDDAPATKAAQPGAAVRRWLSSEEVEALNRAGQYLESTRGTDPLGVRFNRALAHDRKEELADGAIGKPGGLDQAIREAGEIADACERLQRSSAGSPATAAGLFQRSESLVKAARQLHEMSTELPNSFFLRLAGGDPLELRDLVAALNELLALMTPARWAYRDLNITPDLSGTDPGLAFQTSEGARADLLFNTAELNASALALFLLLAPRLPNALRLLILDDPLQNMDELTVVTLGRALAKLQTIYPGGWQILAFFHGEDNIQRIRDEAPCHIYHLPWFRASAAVTAEEPIESLPRESTWPAEWQQPSPDLIADPAAAR